MAEQPSKAASRNTNDRATRNRAIRQDALREQLKASQLISQTLARVKRLDEDSTLDAVKVSAIKAANDASLRLLNKVLPDLKAMELSQDPENPVFKDERALDSELSRLFGIVADAEERATRATSSEGKVH